MIRPCRRPIVMVNTLYIGIDPSGVAWRMYALCNVLITGKVNVITLISLWQGSEAGQ